MLNTQQKKSGKYYSGDNDKNEFIQVAYFFEQDINAERRVEQKPGNQAGCVFFQDDCRDEVRKEDVYNHYKDKSQINIFCRGIGGAENKILKRQ